jgi:hypothetical protein
MEITEDLHVHVEITSTDCDGRMDRGYTDAPHEGQDDYAFKSRILAGLVSWTYPNKVEMTSGYEGGTEWERIEVSYQHDEGWHHAEALFCRDSFCKDAPSTQRDHTAEAAGY